MPDNYASVTSLTGYYPGRDTNRPARHWAVEKAVHDMAALGILSFFEGPGPNPMALSGADTAKLWLRTTGAGVTLTSGSLRRWTGVSPATSELNWVQVSPGSYLQHIGGLSPVTSSESFATRTAAAAATISGGVTYLITAGFANVFDGGGSLYAKGVSFMPGGFTSVDGAIWNPIAEGGRISVKVFGAVANNTDDDASAIQDAIDFANLIGGCVIDFPAGVYRTGDTIFLKSYAHLRANFGTMRIKLLDDADCSIVESDDFDTWNAWTTGSTAGYPVEFSIDGIILDGNAENQGAGVSADLASLVYGLRILSHRYSIGKIQVDDIKGIGIHSKRNSLLAAAVRFDDAGSYGFAGDVEMTTAPHGWGDVCIQDCLYENLVYEGPGDAPIGSLVTNYCGWIDDGTSPPTTPRTSLLFPGEEIHSVRFRTSCKVDYINANAALYGRSVCIDANTRVHADTVITAASWGQILIGANAWGSIGQLHPQQNNYSWGGVYKPYIECVTGTGSTTRKGKFSFQQVTFRRLASGDVDNIGPMIVDNAGHQWGIIDSADSQEQAGHGFVVGATSEGVTVNSFNMHSLRGTGSDGEVSSAIVIESGALDFDFQSVRITDCARAIHNKMTNAKGRISGLIESNRGSTTGQIALEGVCFGSQLTTGSGGSGAVVTTGVNCDANYLPKWDLTLLEDGTRYENRFIGEGTLDLTSTSFQSVSISHKMWRDVLDRECMITVAISGTATSKPIWDTPPAIQSVSDDTIIVDYKVGTSPASTPATQKVYVRIN